MSVRLTLFLFKTPDSSASQIIEAPMRHLTLKLGLRDSTLAKTLPEVTRLSLQWRIANR